MKDVQHKVVVGGGVGEGEEAQNERVFIGLKTKTSDSIQESNETLN